MSGQIQAILHATGLTAEILSGDQEAEYVFRGVTSDPVIGVRPVLIVDVGDGSTEWFVGDGGFTYSAFNLACYLALPRLCLPPRGFNRHSFVQEPEEVDRLVSEIQCRSALRNGREAPGVIAKIETARAVRNLPELIVHGAGRVPFGVMIARGDLAVEIVEPTENPLIFIRNPGQL